MKKLNLFITLMSLITSCNNPVPSGNLTVIECTAINELTGEPIPNKNIKLKECGWSISWAGTTFECPASDSVWTNENGVFDYTFFHADFFSYFLTADAFQDSFCMRTLEVPGGTFVRKTIRMKPLRPLLKVRFLAKDSLKSASIRLESAFECVLADARNNFEKRDVRLGFDTAFSFFVIPFDTVKVAFTELRADTNFLERKTLEIFVEDSSIEVEF